MKRKQPLSREITGFTLIELVVVISILLLLASLSFSVVTGVLRSARRAQAAQMCSQLFIASSAYQTEYGYWPIRSSEEGDGSVTTTSQWTELCTILNGARDPVTQADSLVEKNPRRGIFLHFHARDLAQGPGGKPKPYIVTPFKKPQAGNREVFYRAQFDITGDQRITGLPTPPDGVSLNYTIGIGAAFWVPPSSRIQGSQPLISSYY